MRFVSFRDAGTLRFGVIETQSVVPIPVSLAGGASDLGAALAAGVDLIAAARAALASNTGRLPYASLQLAPPVPRPARILSLGVTGEGTAHPLAFVERDPATLLAPRERCTRPAQAGRFEASVALAVVIGQPARDRTIADALDCVFGYSCFSHLEPHRDGAAAFGPSLVSRDELPPGARDLRIQCRLEGVVLQDAGTADLPCSVAEAIAQLSARMTLAPGDVITLGLPAEAGLVRIRPPGLAPVGRVEVDIDRIGVLTNTVEYAGEALAGHAAARHV